MENEYREKDLKSPRIEIVDSADRLDALQSIEHDAMVVRELTESDASVKPEGLDAVALQKIDSEFYPRRLNETEKATVDDALGEYLKHPRVDNGEACAQAGYREIPNPSDFSVEAEACLPPKGSELRAKCESAFEGEVRVETLKPGDKIYRIFDDTKNVDGVWWSRTPPPETETEWRNRDAVLGSWNANGGYVEYTVPEGHEVKVLIGKTASQAVDGQKWYRGEGEQLFIRGGTGCFDQPGSFTIHKSNWAQS